MASSTFRVKTDNDWNSIYYRLKQGKQFEAELSIGLQVPKGRWSQPKQEVLQTPFLDYKSTNAQLKEFDTFIIREYQATRLIGEILAPRAWLKEKIQIFFNKETNNPDVDKSIFLTNFIQAFIEDAKTRRSRRNTPIKPRTIKHYQTTLNKVIEYEIFFGKRVKLVDINLKFHHNFIELLEKEHHLNPNTIGGYIDDIKLFCSNAEKKEYKVNKDFKLSEFFTPTNQTNDIYLNKLEIKAIFEQELSADYLDNARDWFVIGLWTGLRVSDLLKLNKSAIQDEFIFQVNQKTDYPTIIPIHKDVKAILAKRNGEFPRQISDQKFNDYIKEVCKLSGINETVMGAKIVPIVTNDSKGREKTVHRKKSGLYKKYELVSSHTCRRSFASNLYGKIDSLTIMKITAHKTESQFLKYIKITPIEYAEKLKLHWSKIDF